jgi:hypothetical protein
MKIKILHVAGCPSVDPAKLVIESALKDLGVDAELAIRLIKDKKEARETGFLGSPTILSDGQDVEPTKDTRN